MKKIIVLLFVVASMMGMISFSGCLSDASTTPIPVPYNIYDGNPQ